MAVSDSVDEEEWASDYDSSKILSDSKVSSVGLHVTIAIGEAA